MGGKPRKAPTPCPTSLQQGARTAANKAPAPEPTTLSSLWASISSSVKHLLYSEMLSALEGGGAVGILRASCPWPWQCLLLLLKGVLSQPLSWLQLGLGHPCLRDTHRAQTHRQTGPPGVARSTGPGALDPAPAVSVPATSPACRVSSAKSQSSGSQDTGGLDRNFSAPSVSVLHPHPSDGNSRGAGPGSAPAATFLFGDHFLQVEGQDYSGSAQGSGWRWLFLSSELEGL